MTTGYLIITDWIRISGIHKWLLSFAYLFTTFFFINLVHADQRPPAEIVKWSLAGECQGEDPSPRLQNISSLNVFFNVPLDLKNLNTTCINNIRIVYQNNESATSTFFFRFARNWATFIFSLQLGRAHGAYQVFLKLKPSMNVFQK